MVMSLFFGAINKEFKLADFNPNRIIFTFLIITNKIGSLSYISICSLPLLFVCASIYALAPQNLTKILISR